MPLTPKYGLTLVEEGQADAEVNVNDALNRIDLFTNIWILDRDLTDAPGGESNGDVYLVDGTGTGAWVGHDDELAGYMDGWVFQEVKPGMIAYVEDEDIWIGWNGTAWDTITHS